ncbi:putative RNA-directed DNA polymerase from transposon BS [Trichonephila clavata]|uniref:Putative RNA-directed DNA polymerase from transposon BS n=1 Tax=Trichonephila clavata TaxID=2740835 RepID=A0A8X6GVH0_TRICU|nr:putative RNA-directed DNA polymerase from transposon BS [Trichonephila clavata]
MKLTQAVKDGFHRKQSILAILVDFKAAYDNVWRHMLLHELKKHGAAGNLLNWVQSFLSQRNIRCRFINATSAWKLLLQGLGQGVDLSCLLFNIMIDDLETAIEKVPGISFLFFADDVVIWATGSNIHSLEDTLKSFLLNLATWVNINKIEVSVEKTVSQLFTLSTTQRLFHLEYKVLPLKQVPLYKYLGINLDSKLHWGIAETSESPEVVNCYQLGRYPGCFIHSL